MTLTDNTEGFAQSTGMALSWLRSVEKIAAKSKKRADKDFVAAIGVLMHTMNSLCFDAVDEPEAANYEIDVARKTLRRLEMQTGISDRSASLRRQVIDSMFNLGRESDAIKMLRHTLVRVDADPKGKNIQFREQVAILLQAARIAHEKKLDREQTCTREGNTEI